jgi:hypothetical protein
MENNRGDEKMKRLNAPIFYDMELQRIEIFFSNPAFEADTTTTNVSAAQSQRDAADTGTNKEFRSYDFMKKLDQIITFLKELMERFLVKIKNGFQNLMETYSGFESDMRKAEMDTKPKDAINVITYKYVDAALDQSLSKIENAIFKLIDSIGTDNNDAILSDDYPLNFSNDELVKYVLNSAGFPEEVNNDVSLFHYMRQNFRGDKIQMTIKKESIDYYRITARDLKKCITFINGKVQGLANRTNTLKSKLHVITNNPNTSDEVKRKLLVQSKNLAVLYNLYCSTTHAIFELKTEEVMNARIILKKFYYITT